MRRALQQWPGVVVGLVCGLGVSALLAASAATHPPEAAPGRYQLRTWSTNPSSNGQLAEHGAYRIDTWTGVVHRIDSSSGNATEIDFPQAAH